MTVTASALAFKLPYSGAPSRYFSLFLSNSLSISVSLSLHFSLSLSLHLNLSLLIFTLFLALSDVGVGVGVGEIINSLLMLVLVSFSEIQLIGFILFPVC